MKPFVAAVLALAFSLPLTGLAREIEPSMVTARVEGTDIDIYLYRPKGTGPFPLLILSDGAPSAASGRADPGGETLRIQARAYANSGVAVAVPIRRAHGEGGQEAGGDGGCAGADYHAAGLAGARDIEGAIAVVSKLPGIDAKRVVLMGESQGGWASVAAATRGGVLGVVDFAGKPASRGPGDLCRTDELVRAAGLYGGGAKRVPQLWIYSRNDHYLDLAAAHAMHDAFVAGGGQAIFRTAPSVPGSGRTYIDEIARWKTSVDTFLVIVGFLR